MAKPKSKLKPKGTAMSLFALIMALVADVKAKDWMKAVEDVLALIKAVTSSPPQMMAAPGEDVNAACAELVACCQAAQTEHAEMCASGKVGWPASWDGSRIAKLLDLILKLAPLFAATAPDAPPA